MSETVALTGRDLTVDAVARVARGAASAALSDDARAAIEASAAALERHVREGTPIYGLTTGVGALHGHPLAPEDRAAWQLFLLRSHAAGVGPPLAEEEVRAMLLARVNAFCGGASGVSPAVVERLLLLLERGVTPVVPSRGSVGAADLAPLAHAALVLAGEGRATHDGRTLPGWAAMEGAGIPLARLGGRDGLALINGPAQTVGTAALAVVDAERLIEAAEAIVALGMTALDGPAGSIDPRALAGKPHPGTTASAARIRELLAGRLRPRAETVAAEREPLSTRCAAHVCGAARDALARARQVVEAELNAAVDNPMIPADGWVTSDAANFDAHLLAQALDGATEALTALAASSERRTARLLDPTQNGGLPPFLVHPAAPAGLHSGLMVAQCTAASLVAELRTRAAPVSGHSLPTCAGYEDLVSLSPLAARRLAWAVETAATVVAIELLAAGQALDVSGRSAPPGVARVHAALRARVPVLVEDRVVSDDVERARELVRAGAAAEVPGPAVAAVPEGGPTQVAHA